MSSRTRTPVLAVARRIACFGLGGVEPVSVDPRRWRQLLAVLTSQRLTGLAMAGLRAGWLEISAAEAAELMERQALVMLRSLATERMLVDLAAELDRAGIRFTVLKGPAIAHTAYPDPSWRPFGDLDVLVRGQDWQRSRTIVERLGFVRDLPEPRPGFDVRFGKAATHTNPEGLQIDLHRTLAMGPFGLWIDSDELVSATARFELGGREVPRLDDPSLFLHACVHASLGWSPPLLMPMRDVAQIATALGFDREAITMRARSWRLGAVVEHALRSTLALVGDQEGALTESLKSIGATHVERRALLAYTTSRRRRGGMTIATVRAIPGLAAKAEFLMDLVLPTRDFLLARSRSRGRASSYAGRWAVPTGWLREGFDHVRRRGGAHVRDRRDS
jgi:hypothetical protein